jgi:DNA-binding transcriptional LysR family regulator
MELRHLRYFVALAEERHFTRAAKRLHIAQPALSQQIARLEAELGTPLVDRTTRHVALTQAGTLLLAHARRMLAQEAAARAELDDLAGLRRGHLDIGAAQAMGPVDLARLLLGFHRRHPAVELTVREALSVDLDAAVHDDELDLAFVTGSVRGDGIDSTQIATEELVCILGPAHPLAGRDLIRLTDLRHDSFVMFAGSATIRRQVETATARVGYTPRVGFETSDVTRIRALVAAGLGVAIIPRSDARARGPKVTVAPIKDRGLEHTVSVCWRSARRHSPAARAFLDLALAARESLDATSRARGRRPAESP